MPAVCKTKKYFIIGTVWSIRHTSSSETTNSFSIKSKTKTIVEYAWNCLYPLTINYGSRNELKYTVYSVRISNFNGYISEIQRLKFILWYRELTILRTGKLKRMSQEICNWVYSLGPYYARKTTNLAGVAKKIRQN